MPLPGVGGWVTVATDFGLSVGKRLRKHAARAAVNADPEQYLQASA